MEKELESNYANAFGGMIGFGNRPALILVDFVKAYFEPDCELYADVDDELASALRIREAARSSAADIPIIFTNVVIDKSEGNGGRFYQKVPSLKNFVEGSAMGEWPDGLQPEVDELVVSKQYPSAFFGTSLSSTLTARGIDTLIITGLTTSGCVRATCVDCMSYGFIPIIVSDACGDRHEAPHSANLFDMNAKYGDVVSEQAAVKYLQDLQK